ncbi:MAG: aspartyl/asparaginyl beta-hydroxylase domain-containing protein [Bacteroidetes bacterium]|nr:aspartyl/asparaginyl beta-hydroxylase domain-containing protein [Bacteroidota bacterium]
MSFTEKNPKYFYETTEFPELKILEENYLAILEELQNLRKSSENGYWLNTFPDYLFPESKGSWKVFTFRFFGIRHPLNCSLCPKTAALLEKIPGLVSADFSFLPAKTHIKPHVGFTPVVLRSHLGLVIPDDCGIRVGDQTRKWEHGKLLVFDDSFDHEAWNNSDEDRFVLMFDIRNPRWEYSVDQICRYHIENMKDEFMLTICPKEQWLDFYEKGEFYIMPAKK